MTGDIRSRAREFRALSGPEAIRGHTGVSDTDYAYVCAVGEAQEIIGDLLAIVDRLDVGEEPEWDSADSNAYQDRVEAGLEPEDDDG